MHEALKNCPKPWTPGAPAAGWDLEIFLPFFFSYFSFLAVRSANRMTVKSVTEVRRSS